MITKRSFRDDRLDKTEKISVEEAAVELNHPEKYDTIGVNDAVVEGYKDISNLAVFYTGPIEEILQLRAAIGF